MRTGGRPLEWDGEGEYRGAPGTAPAVVNLSLRPVLLTLEEAAELLRIGRTRMFALVGRGEIRSVRIGGSRRVPVVAVEEYVEALLAAGEVVPARQAV